MSTKKQIRKKMQERRNSLNDTMRCQLAKQFTQHLFQTRLFKTSNKIACYLPFNGEMDLQFVIQQIWKMNKTCYLPVLNKLNQRQLLFSRFDANTQLKKNKFGIHEPVVSPRNAVNAHNLDLILMPLVAFDQSGNRLGMGGGFYDRTLAFLTQRTIWLKPKIVGVAYEFQQVNSIKNDAWDIPLNAVMTEIKQYEFTQENLLKPGQ